MIESADHIISYLNNFNIPHETATGTGVGTIRRFLISVGAIVITVGLVGVLLPEEAVDRNDCESFSTVDVAEDITPVLSLSAILESWKT